MQEILKIYSAEGEVLLERDLSGVTEPLMIIAGEKPVLSVSVPAGADVIGALVRDEDGWMLASAKSDVPVTSGPKSGSDFHLTAGVACLLAQWVFKIEREGAAVGSVLVWRFGSSSIVADQLIQGRNIVAETKDGRCEVNPAIAGETLCEIFPAGSGVEVVTGGEDSRRLKVDEATLFSVGPFQAMVLNATDAAKAVKSGNAFSWPARNVRQGLLLSAILVGLVGLAAVYVGQQKSKLDAILASRHGAERIERAEGTGKTQYEDEDILAYRFSFFRSLPLVLQAEPSPVTVDLVKRGEQLSGHIGGNKAEAYEKDLQRMLKFLKDVQSIKASVIKGDFVALKGTLAGADREMFTRCDADKFYDDAKEIDVFIMEILPKFMAVMSESASEDFESADKRIKEYFDALFDNIFMSGKIIRRERDNAEERWKALSEYVPEREKFRTVPGDSGTALVDAWIDLVDALDPEDEAFAPIIERERKKLSDIVISRAEAADDVALVNLVSLGEAVGVDPELLGKWSERAKEARKNLVARYHELYSDYRMRSAVAPDDPATLAVLDEMIAMGLEDNTYHQWALRERERVQQKGEIK